VVGMVGEGTSADDRTHARALMFILVAARKNNSAVGGALPGRELASGLVDKGGKQETDMGVSRSIGDRKKDRVSLGWHCQPGGIG
jgi:hypothetical protein